MTSPATTYYRPAGVWVCPHRQAGRQVPPVPSHAARSAPVKHHLPLPPIYATDDDHVSHYPTHLPGDLRPDWHHACRSPSDLRALPGHHLPSTTYHHRHPLCAAPVRGPATSHHLPAGSYCRMRMLIGPVPMFSFCPLVTRCPCLPSLQVKVLVADWGSSSLSTGMRRA